MTGKLHILDKPEHKVLFTVCFTVSNPIVTEEHINTKLQLPFQCPVLL